MRVSFVYNIFLGSKNRTLGNPPNYKWPIDFLRIKAKKLDELNVTHPFGIFPGVVNKPIGLIALSTLGGKSGTWP